MKKLLIAATFSVLSITAYTQAVGIGTTSPNASAMLDVTSSNKGFLAPRMNSSTRTGIPSPAAGLLIFDTTTGSYWYYSGSTWVNLAGSGGSSPWNVNGNYIYHLSDSLGLGTSSPDEKLHISNGQMRLSRTAPHENKIIFSMPATNGITSETQGLKFQLSSVDKAFIGYSSTSFSGNYLRLSGNGVNASDLVITSTGDIGMGTSVPTEKLHVAGNIKTSGNISAVSSIVSESTVQGGALVTSGQLVTLGNGTISGDLQTNSDLIINNVAAELKLKTSGADKGFVQLSGDNLRMGTYSSNINGKFIVRVGGSDRMIIDNAGNVSIGTSQVASGYKVNIGGKIMCEELKVQLRASWPDYVFSPNYRLNDLYELEKFIQSNNHLPNIPAAAEIEKNGLETGEMQRLMMEKIEELTLYIIDLKKELDSLKKQIK